MRRSAVILSILVLALAGCSSLVQTQGNAKWLGEIFAGVKCPAPQSCPKPPPPCEPCKECPPVVTPPPVTPPPETGMVVREGVRVERRLRVPAWVEFHMSGKQPSVEDGGPQDNCTIAWSYVEWGGGDGPGAASGRDYKLKVYHADGSFAGERRYGFDWRPEKTYLVRLEIGRDQTRLLVDGAEVAAVDADAADEVTMGYGDPPSKRPGPYGAVITDVRWSEP